MSVLGRLALAAVIVALIIAIASLGNATPGTQSPPLPPPPPPPVVEVVPLPAPVIPTAEQLTCRMDNGMPGTVRVGDGNLLRCD